MSDILIKAENVSKKYCKSLKDSMQYGISDIGRNLIGLSSNSGRLRKNEFWSIDDVSFEVKRGETLGLVGPNGSGKTTMLKMINGIFWPDKGKITVKGRIGALIAVGSGFHPLLTGRENIYVNGAILGMTKSEVNQKFDTIVNFSGIGEFLDSPVKHYSSGMYVRLGFAIAVHSECEILLIDEVLSVGDIEFQTKCMEKINELGRKGVTKIFVSHSFDAVQKLCQKCIYLNHGKIRSYGETNQVLEDFKKDVTAGEVLDTGALRYGNREIEINKIELMDSSDNQKQEFTRGERLKIKISFYAKSLIENPIFSIMAWNDKGYMVYGTQTKRVEFETGKIQGKGEITHTIEVLLWHTGKYWLSIGCRDSNENITYDHHTNMNSLIVKKGPGIPNEWIIK